MKILLIGSGNWGKNYINTLKEFDYIELTVANRNNWKELVENSDGVIIATPPETHYEIAEFVLNKDKFCMIEKPVTLSLEEINKLSKYSNKILVNNIHLFSEYFNKLYINSLDHKLNKIYSEGFNIGPIRSTYSSLWDYGPHDIGMILYLANKMPIALKCCEILNKDSMSLFEIQLIFDSFTSYSIVGNGGDKKSRLFRCNFDNGQFSYFESKDTQYKMKPLKCAISQFIALIKGHKSDRCGLELSIKITKILELCEVSMKNNTTIFL